MAKAKPNHYESLAQRADEMSHDEFVDEVFTMLESEKKAALSRKTMDEIENAFMGLQPYRRLALAFMTKRWSTSEKEVRRNPEFAASLASLFDVLGDAIEKHKSMAGLMETAQARIAAALCSREDTPRAVEQTGPAT